MSKENFVSLLQQEGLELRFEWITLDSVSCNALSFARVRCLSFSLCELEVGGEALVRPIASEQGPTELRIFSVACDFAEMFDSFQRFTSFNNGLRGNAHLQKLCLSFAPFGQHHPYQ